jgi:hypothetical protein
MAVWAQRDPALLTLPCHVTVPGAFVADPEVVVCAVVGNLAPFVARALGRAVSKHSLWHCCEAADGELARQWSAPVERRSLRRSMQVAHDLNDGGTRLKSRALSRRRSEEGSVGPGSSDLEDLKVERATAVGETK